MESLSAARLYERFERVLAERKSEDWTLVLFEGSPDADAYSWCPDCVALKDDVRSFLVGYSGPVKFVQFKVGSKKEWEGTARRPNPFKKGLHLSDLPTAVLFRGRLDVARVSIPRRRDLAYLCQRAKIYEEQARDGVWHIPKAAG